MPMSLTGIEALVALIAVIVFLVSIGKWIQMREAIAQRVIDVDTQLKEITDWRGTIPVSLDNLYVRRENCGLHMDNFDSRLAHIDKSLDEIKKVLDTLIHARR